MSKPNRKKEIKMDARVKYRKAAAALVKGASVSQALQQAGYSESTARHHGGEILEGIRAEFAIELDRQVNQAEIVEELLRIATSAMVTERLMNQKSGEVSEFTDIDNFARLKALELLGKFTGSFTQRSELNVTHGLDPATVLAARRRAEQAQAAITAEVVRELPAASTDQEDGEEEQQ